MISNNQLLVLFNNNVRQARCHILSSHLETLQAMCVLYLCLDDGSVPRGITPPT